MSTIRKHYDKWQSIVRVAGYYVDRQIIKKDSIDDMSEEQLEARMKQITDDYSELLADEPKRKKNGVQKNGQ